MDDEESRRGRRGISRALRRSRRTVRAPLQSARRSHRSFRRSSRRPAARHDGARRRPHRRTMACASSRLVRRAESGRDSSHRTIRARPRFDRRPATTTKPPSLRHRLEYLDTSAIPAGAVVDGGARLYFVTSGPTSSSNDRERVEERVRDHRRERVARRCSRRRRAPCRRAPAVAPRRDRRARCRRARR